MPIKVCMEGNVHLLLGSSTGGDGGGCGEPVYVEFSVGWVLYGLAVNPISGSASSRETERIRVD